MASSVAMSGTTFIWETSMKDIRRRCCFSCSPRPSREEVGLGIVIVGVGAFDGAMCLRREGKSTIRFVIFEGREECRVWEFDALSLDGIRLYVTICMLWVVCL